MSEQSTKASIDFTPGALLEARDFSDTWYPAKVVEVDLDGREVLVHFLNWSSRFDEWISMDSARLRPKVPEDVIGSTKVQRNKEFQVGDKVIALWKNSKKYPARVTRVINENVYEVVFYDGFVMEVRPKNMSLIPKEEADKLEIPATNPATIAQWADTNPVLNEELSKEERRRRKQKIDVVSLFKSYTKKKQEQDKTITPKTTTEAEPESIDTAANAATQSPVQSPSVAAPVPTPAAVASPAPGTAPLKKERVPAKERESFLLHDAKLPPGWEKRAVRRVSGSTAGKWDVVIHAPDSRAFRSRQDVRLYLSHHNLNYDANHFDFRLGEEFYRERGVEPPKRGKGERKAKAPQKLTFTAKPAVASEVQPAAPVVPSPTVESSPAPVTPQDQNTPSAPLEDGYRCPLEDCRKLFRRENLLMMHIKHYHPALSKQLGCKSLKVEDMATARTAYDTEEGRNLPSTPLPPVKPLPPIPSEKKIVAAEPVVAAEEVEVPPLAKRARGNSESKIAEPPSPAVSTKVQGVFPKKNRKKQLSTSFERVVFTIGEPETPTEAAGALSEDGTEDFDLDSEYMDTKLDDLGPAHAEFPLDAIPNQKELVHCYCGILEEDGLMIQCELCLAWQHGVCLGIESEKGVPDPYICQYCRYPFRERPSRHHSYDQSWIKKGKVAAPSFSEETPAQVSHASLRISHALVSAALELKEVLHSLRVQADIAQKKDHPKLYLWSKLENGQEEHPSEVGPSIPRPEPPINSLDCRLNLLQHINQLQDEIEARLSTMESTLDGLESENPTTGNSSQFPRTLQALLKDVTTIKKMASYAPRQFF